MKQRAVQTAKEKVQEHPREQIGRRLLSVVQLARMRGTIETAEAALEWERAIQERLNAMPEKKAA